MRYITLVRSPRSPCVLPFLAGRAHGVGADAGIVGPFLPGFDDLAQSSDPQSMQLTFLCHNGQPSPFAARRLLRLPTLGGAAKMMGSSLSRAPAEPGEHECHFLTVYR